MGMEEYNNIGGNHLGTPVRLFENLPYIVDNLTMVTNMDVYWDGLKQHLPSFMDPPIAMKPCCIDTDGNTCMTMGELIMTIHEHDGSFYNNQNDDDVGRIYEANPLFMDTQSHASSITMNLVYTPLGDEKSTATNQPLAHLTFDNVATLDAIVPTGATMPPTKSQPTKLTTLVLHSNIIMKT